MSETLKTLGGKDTGCAEVRGRSKYLRFREPVVISIDRCLAQDIFELLRSSHNSPQILYKGEAGGRGWTLFLYEEDEGVTVDVTVRRARPTLCHARDLVHAYTVKDASQVPTTFLVNNEDAGRLRMTIKLNP